jgi:hypothetical protein
MQQKMGVPAKLSKDLVGASGRSPVRQGSFEKAWLTLPAKLEF